MYSYKRDGVLLLQFSIFSYDIGTTTSVNKHSIPDKHRPQKFFTLSKKSRNWQCSCEHSVSLQAN